MTLTNGYCTLDDIKDQREIVSADSADDAFIEDAITAASRYIDGVANRRFYKDTADQTRTYRARGGAVLLIDDLVSVTTLKTDDDGDRTYETTWAATDYDLMPANASNDSIPYTWIEITPNGNNSFPTQAKGVQIVGKFGFPAVPADIEYACRLIAMRAYQNRYGQNTDGPATITGAGVVIKPADVPKLATDLIKRWTRFS
jgi:hypothetical protein